VLPIVASAASPALLARERQILDRYTAALAAPIAEDTAAEPGDLRPEVAARALIGTHQSLIQLVRRRLAEGPVTPEEVAREVVTRGRQALDLLEQGLAGYRAKPAG
jgi:hypothetical protein